MPLAVGAIIRRTLFGRNIFRQQPLLLGFCPSPPTSPRRPKPFLIPNQQTIQFNFSFNFNCVVTTDTFTEDQPCVENKYYKESETIWKLIMARAKATKGKKSDPKTADKNVEDKVEEEKNKTKGKATKKDVKEKVEKEEKATPQKAKGKKRPAEDADADSSDAPKPKLTKGNSISDSLGDTDFSLSSKSPAGTDANFKIASWNINGVRAWLAKDGPSYLKKEDPDVLCIQELKCDISKIPAELSVEGYSTKWLSGDTEGYSGVGMYFKNKPITITEGIGIKKHDGEGRVLTAEFEKFYLVNTYIPNSGRGLVRHKYRTKEWDNDFLEYLKTLDKKKPVIWCGDLNVAHKEIDIKNAKGNKKNAGFTQEERDNFSAVLEAGFIDAFRHLHPEEEHAYSFWAYFMNARGKNVGWRLDYFVMSERLKENLCESALRTKVMGSDHCPIVLELAL